MLFAKFYGCKWSNYNFYPLDISEKHLDSLILYANREPPYPPFQKRKVGFFKSLSQWGRGTLRENAPRSWRGVFSIPAMSIHDITKVDIYKTITSKYKA